MTATPPAAGNSPLDALATPEQVAEYLHMTVGSLAQMRYVGNGPRFLKVTGNKVRYRWSDVASWLDARVHTQTGQAS